MTKKKVTKKKKLLLSLTALILVAAIGAGIFFVARGGSEPVNVFSFQFIGMTEYWGDSQESYGPVSTDKIQTVFLTDTQTVTEVKVQSGDTVKKGDVLLTFDTTLDSLSLERKRLEVEKVKVQIQAAAEQLEKVYDMIPYHPPVFEEEETDLGEELKDAPYKISEKEIYDGSTMEKALICWMQKDVPISNDVLRALYDTALTYQLKNAEKEESKETSSASDTPELPVQPEQPEQPVPEEPKQEQTQPEVPTTQQTPPEEPANPVTAVEETVTTPAAQTLAEGDAVTPPEPPAPPVIPTIPIKIYCNDELVVDRQEPVNELQDVRLDVYTYNNKTYWFQSAKRGTGEAGSETLTQLNIPLYPETEEEQQKWMADWGNGLEVRYVRSVSISGSRMENGELVSFPTGSPVQLEIEKDTLMMVTSSLEQMPKETKCTYTVTPGNGILKSSANGQTLILTGKPEALTQKPETYTVRAMYIFLDNQGQERAVAEEFTFDLSVVAEPMVKKGEFYVVFKVTEDNFQRGTPVTWQGVKVYVYEDSFGMNLFDAYSLEDHTLPPEEEIEIELPVIDPEHTYTAEQIEDMKKQLTETLHDQKIKLKMAEAEYKIMEQELGDGNIYADIDGEVISVLTEEEAKDTKQPLVKVSGGGGFFIEGAVSELEKDNLRIGQEVTINDWNTGSTYTGEVESIGDFPSNSNGWTGMGNPNASFYPFRVFIDGSADLQAGSYVSMTYSTSSAEHGVYLESPFILTEQGNSYVYAKGAGGKLEKRPVVVGKSLWGTYKEILSGVTEEDFLAFPYGKDIREGAATVESDISALYTY